MIFFLVLKIMVIIVQNSILAEMKDFDPLKGCFLKVRLKWIKCLDGGNSTETSYQLLPYKLM